MNLSQLRDPALIKPLLRKVEQAAREAAQQLGRRPIFMEVCGTHTTAIARSGLRTLLEEWLELRSGPGCPVCVTDNSDLDTLLALARQPGVLVVTFGDMLRVPGSVSSLEKERAQGAQVQVIYSPQEALALAENQRHRQVVLVGVGFETTVPLVALCLQEAQARQLKNFTLLSLHKRVPPVLHALLADPAIQLEGLLLPGHVCAVIGRRPFDFIAQEYGVPAVVTGFEPLDILGALHNLLTLLQNHRPQVVNGYARVVREEGNPRALELLERYFEQGPARWRGFGDIPHSGLTLKPAFRPYDAAALVPPMPAQAIQPRGCRCGDVLRGKLTPPQCPLFGQVCTPTTPQGPCMVSSEGACAASYQFGKGQ